MAVKEYFTDTIECGKCGVEGTASTWEWENPMHHDSDFSRYTESVSAGFTLSAGRITHDECGGTATRH